MNNNIIIFIIFTSIILFIYWKFIHTKNSFFDKKIIFSKLLISLIITFFMAIFLQKMYYSLIYEETNETSVVLEATSKKNNMAEGNEILLRYIEIDGKKYDAYDYIKEGNWLYYCGGAHWKNYDLDKPITTSIKINVPKGFKKSLIFQNNKWRGIVNIKYRGYEKELDLYKNAESVEEEIEFKLNENTIFSKYEIYFLSFLYILTVIFNMIIIEILIILNNKLIKNRKSIKIDINEIVYYFIIALLTFLITFTYTDSPWSKVVPWVDADIYLYNGYAMNKGLTIYKDIFDNKGILLQIIQFLGYRFSNSYIGVWYIETIILFITFCFFYNTSRIFFKKNTSIFIVILTISTMPVYLQLGNYSESYALVFVSISMYLFVKNIYKNDALISKIHSFIIGLCFVCVFLLRQNLISIWMVFCPFIFFKLIFDKKYKIVINFIIYFFFGVLSVLIPFYIYLLFNDAVKEYIYACFTMNFKYVSSGYNGELSNYDRLKVIIFFIKNYNCVIAFLSIVYSIYSKIIKKRKIDKSIFTICILSYIYIIITFILLSISGDKWLHYGIILFPSFLLSNIIFTLCIKDLISNYNYSNQVFFLLGMLACIVIFEPNSLINFQKQHIWVINSDYVDPEIKYICNLIKENTDSNDRILVYGINNRIYLQSDRLSSSKYFNQSPYVSIEKDIENSRPVAITLEKEVYYNSKSSGLDLFIKDYVNREYKKLFEGKDIILFFKKVEKTI